MTFRIDAATVAVTDEGPVTTGKVTDLIGEIERSIRDVLAAAEESAEVRTATGEAAEWLRGYLVSVGGTSDSAKVKEGGRRAGHSQDALKRARQRLKVVAESVGFPRRPSGGCRPSGSKGRRPSERSPVGAALGRVLPLH